jgi:hypothetical protein
MLDDFNQKRTILELIQTNTKTKSLNFSCDEDPKKDRKSSEAVKENSRDGDGAEDGEDGEDGDDGYGGDVGDNGGGNGDDGYG